MPVTVEDRLSALERENTEIKHRLSTVEGQFAFIVGQLRDLQLYMHARFEQMDQRFGGIDRRLNAIDGRMESMERKFDKRFDEIPGIVRDVMREVLAERGR